MSAPCPAPSGPALDSGPALGPDRVTIFGYGSLMDASSALRTMPAARNFRRGVLRGFHRRYSLVSVSGIRSGNADLNTLEVAALAIRSGVGRGGRGCRGCRNSEGCCGGCGGCKEAEDEGAETAAEEMVLGVLFDIPCAQLGPYLEREHRYRPMQVSVQEWGGVGGVGARHGGQDQGSRGGDSSASSSSSGGSAHSHSTYTTAWAVVEQTDEAYKTSLHTDTTQAHLEYQRRVGQFYSGRLWGREDILPMAPYMVSVLYAAYKIGDSEWLQNNLDALLADGRSLRGYLRGRLRAEEAEVGGTGRPFCALLDRAAGGAAATLADDRQLRLSQVVLGEGERGGSQCLSKL
ncbi:hypothetical protein B484DRAFT_450649 [Ochromonadaceae sp. CCMP2298]|nr:hypothetical protein B484DRAFT_450649 [Ochromonadaceae sp. CCMP2298]